MRQIELLNHIELVVCLAGLVYLVFWRYNSYRLDCLRQDLFDLRNQLFDDARNGLIDIDHPMHRLFRSTMNGYIRFGHKLSIWQLYLVNLFLGKDVEKIGSSFAFRYHLYSKDLDADQVEKFKQYREKMHHIIAKHLILNSVVATFLFAIAICVAAIVRIKQVIALKAEIREITKPKKVIIQPKQHVSTLLPNGTMNTFRAEEVGEIVFRKIEETCKAQYDDVDTAAFACGSKS